MASLSYFNNIRKSLERINFTNPIFLFKKSGTSFDALFKKQSNDKKLRFPYMCTTFVSSSLLKK